MRKALAGALAVLFLVSGCGDTGEDGARPPKDRLPSVTLPGIAGGADVDLGTFKGPAVVNLWASWCEPCKRELPIYAEFARTSAGKVSVLGVDFQESQPAKAIALAKRSGVGYPLVADHDGKLRAIGLPQLILIDATGRIAYQEYVEIKSLAQLKKLVAEHLEVAASVAERSEGTIQNSVPGSMLSDAKRGQL